MPSTKPHITIRMTPGMLERVERYRDQMEKREKVSISRTAAVVSLIEKGLGDAEGLTECQLCGSTEGVRLVQTATSDFYLCRECRPSD